MDYELLSRFTPRIIAVYNRDEAYWQEFQYSLLRERTRLHSLAYVYSGKGMLEFGDNVYTLMPGHLFQVCPGQRMHISTSSKSPLYFYSVQFTYGLIHWEGTNMVWQGTDELLPFPIMIASQEHVGLHNAYRRLHDLWSEMNNGFEWNAKLIFLDILNQIITLQQNEQKKESNATAAIQEAIDYMKAHFGEDVSRDRLAEYLSLSPGYFSILFKKQTGCSPIQYLNKIRIDRAKHLLKTTHVPIKLIAQEVGFPDSFYFTRIFTKDTGMSPRDYRNA